MESIPPEIILKIISGLDKRSRVSLKRTCSYLSRVVTETKRYSVPMRYYSIAQICYESLTGNLKETGRDLKVSKQPFAIDMLKDMYEIENNLPRKTRVQHRPGCLVHHMRPYWSVVSTDPSTLTQKIDEYIVINLDPKGMDLVINKPYNYLHSRLIRFRFTDKNVFVKQVLYPCDHYEHDIKRLYSETFTLDEMRKYGISGCFQICY